MIEYRVNDARGIHGPFDREAAEQTYADLLASCEPGVRPPLLEVREDVPWHPTAPATDTSKGDSDE